MPSTYGGEINTPTMDRIAKGGISYNRFHTTAMCSPTRASLLTGRNHHRVGNGQIAELANDWDGYSGVIPKTSATVAEVLKDYGYATSAFGKWHNTPAEQTTAAGRSSIGRRATASNISTASSPARRRNTSRTSCATRPYVQHPPRPRAQLLSPERGSGRRRDQLAAQSEGIPAGQAVLHVLGERRRRTARTTS